MYFEFDELLADMFNVSDEQREDDDFIHNLLFERFNMDYDDALKFTCELLRHTNPINAALTGTTYHAFLNKSGNCMLMKTPPESK